MGLRRPTPPSPMTREEPIGDMKPPGITDKDEPPINVRVYSRCRNRELAAVLAEQAFDIDSVRVDFLF